MTDYSRADARGDAAAEAGTLDDLDAVLAGDLLRPDDPEYDEGRRVWNGAVDRFPVAVARVTGIRGIRAVLETAATLDRQVAIRAGGHSGPGFSTVDGGIVLDLSAMDEVLVDPENRVARVGPGATWGDLDRATQRHGLATPGGIVSDTGVAGLTLGGGTGWLTRAHGLASDAVRAVELLTVDGTFVRTGPDSHPQLFAALQGGGGNFSVVTTFEFDLVPLDHDVTLLESWYPIDDAPDVLRTYRRLQSDAPPTVTVSPYVSALPDTPSRLGVCVLGVSLEPPGNTEYLEQFAAAEPIEGTHERLSYVDLQHRFDEDGRERDHVTVDRGERVEIVAFSMEADAAIESLPDPIRSRLPSHESLEKRNASTIPAPSETFLEQALETAEERYPMHSVAVVPAGAERGGMGGMMGGGGMGSGGMGSGGMALPPDATKPSVTTLSADRQGQYSLDCGNYCGYGHQYMAKPAVLAVQ